MPEFLDKVKAGELTCKYLCCWKDWDWPERARFSNWCLRDVPTAIYGCVLALEDREDVHLEAYLALDCTSTRTSTLHTHFRDHATSKTVSRQTATKTAPRALLSIILSKIFWEHGELFQTDDDVNFTSHFSWSIRPRSQIHLDFPKKESENETERERERERDREREREREKKKKN